MDAYSIGQFIAGGAVALAGSIVVVRRILRALDELTKDKGQNGSATIRRTLREIQEDVRDTRDLAARVEGRFDTLDDKVDAIGERVSQLEYVTGLRKTR